jgi:hypothetical protein
MAAHLSLVVSDEIVPAPSSRRAGFSEAAGSAWFLLSRVAPVPRTLRHLLERAVLGLLPAPSLATVQVLPVVADTPPERLQLVR